MHSAWLGFLLYEFCINAAQLKLTLLSCRDSLLSQVLTAFKINNFTHLLCIH